MKRYNPRIIESKGVQEVVPTMNDDERWLSKGVSETGKEKSTGR